MLTVILLSRQLFLPMSPLPLLTTCLKPTSGEAWTLFALSNVVSVQNFSSDVLQYFTSLWQLTNGFEMKNREK